ncbi:MAG TPA: DUF2249 domain-containing protein, partial [Gammaproteobacteria bacterium]|nr:DUF2249 domain-containing protein [Gammaproteobacteria bacterium]
MKDSTALVAPTDRVSDVLARDEALVDVFVRHAPHFAKLRNRAMRRVMARLVTVEQAARTAGVSAGRLVDDLNAALGTAPERRANAGPATAAPPNGIGNAGLSEPPSEWPVVEVDVRDDLRTGREPFSRIMAAVAALRAGEVLHLRAIFEPVPLLAVMEKRGFTHAARRHAADDWSVWFWRAAAAVAAMDRPTAMMPAALAPSERTVVLDVRGLEPPEPMRRTLSALDGLPAGH